MLQKAIPLAFLAVIGNRVGAMPACSLSTAPTVKLDRATVTGITSESGSTNHFLGIPFAQPPTGQLRFQLPQELPPYDEDFSATNSGNACPQIVNTPPPQGRLRIELYNQLATENVTYSEDCLTLNVVTPVGTTPDSRLPVVVWIHGGGFENGQKADPKFDANAIVDTSVNLGVPAIYVSINYRLNLFGFLAGQEVKNAGVGNLGLQDQRHALKWVQKYISAFGGDPAKVTIWGESAGAISVSFHMLANGGNPDGLFRAAFMQSGSPVNSGDMSHGQQYYDILVAEVGCTGANSLQCLRNVDYEVLEKAMNLPELSSGGGLKNPWCPRIDGVFLTANPYDLVRRKAVANIPFVNGVCDDEGTVFSVMKGMGMFTDMQFGNYLQETWMANSPMVDVMKVMQLYPSDPARGSPFDTGNFNAITPQYKRLAAFHGDLMFQGPHRFFLANLYTRQKTWAFLNKRGKSTPVVGAFHSSDLDIIFGGQDMTSYLVRFVTNLDPNVGQSTDIHWPQYNPNPLSRTLLQFSDGMSFEDSNYPTDNVDWASIGAQFPVEVSETTSLAGQSLVPDNYRLGEIAYLFSVAEQNPF